MYVLAFARFIFIFKWTFPWNSIPKIAENYVTFLSVSSWKSLEKRISWKIWTNFMEINNDCALQIFKNKLTFHETINLNRTKCESMCVVYEKWLDMNQSVNAIKEIRVTYIHYHHQFVYKYRTCCEVDCIC